VGVDFFQLRRNGEFGRVGHELGVSRHAVDRHFVTALDGEHGLELRIEKPPMAGLGAGFEMVVGHRELLDMISRAASRQIALPFRWNMTGQALA
jgi:hypothetical protein